MGRVEFVAQIRKLEVPGLRKLYNKCFDIASDFQGGQPWRPTFEEKCSIADDVREVDASRIANSYATLAYHHPSFFNIVAKGYFEVTSCDTLSQIRASSQAQLQSGLKLALIGSSGDRLDVDVAGAHAVMQTVCGTHRCFEMIGWIASLASTSSRLSACLLKQKPKIAVIVCHGAAEGLFLESKIPFPPHAFANAVKAGHVQVILLLCCEGESVADAVVATAPECKAIIYHRDKPGNVSANQFLATLIDLLLDPNSNQRPVLQLMQSANASTISHSPFSFRGERDFVLNM